MATKVPFLTKAFSAYQHRERPAPGLELTQVGPGTPCGEYVRRYWHPIITSEAVQDLPQRLHILGEDLVVFRDQGGAMGLLERTAPNRPTATCWAVPIDDTHTMQIGFNRAPEGREVRRGAGFGQDGKRPYEERQRVPGDYDAQVSIHGGTAVHDLEHLASTDRGITVLRNMIRRGIHAVQSIKKLAEVGEWLTADHQGRGGGDRPIWDCAQQGRVGYSAMGGKPVTNVVTGNGHSFRHTSKVPAELQLWLAQTTASGMIPWFVWLGSKPEDIRWQDTGRKFYQWIARHEAHFANRKPVASLGVVYSQRLNHLYQAPSATPGGYGAVASKRPPAPGDPSDFLQGMYYALLEGRFVFDFIHEDDLTPASLGKYTAVVLPNIALLSDEQCRSLRSYTQSGGSLLATFETGLYNESGQPRKEFGLADVFGIQRSGDRAGAYFYGAIERPHDLLQGFTDTKWLPGGEWRVPLQPVSDPVLTVVPPYPRGIPEMVYAQARAEMSYPGARSKEPAVVLREKGQSRLVYFPGDVDRSAWRSGNSDLSLLLQNAIRWLTRNQSPVTVQGEGMAEVFAWETEPGYAIHILNYNNPNMTRPWIRKSYALGPQRVRVELPAGVKVSRVELLAAETKPAFTLNGRVLEFTVPRVDDYEIAALYRA